MLKTLVVLVACLVVAGCSTPGSYTRIPARFTTLPSAPSSESYLIELVHATSDPKATRYDFALAGGAVALQISTISKTGARSERRLSEDVAARLLKVFRAFDWSSIEAPPPDDDAGPLPANDTEVVIKARTSKSYREAHVRLAECASVRRFMSAVEAAK